MLGHANTNTIPQLDKYKYNTIQYKYENTIGDIARGDDDDVDEDDGSGSVVMVKSLKHARSN